MSEPEGELSRVVKNPLLSASVTGLTFQDFPNKPLLLPAAPPPEKAQIPGGIEEEKQKSVTVGQKPEIDAETLSEINLSNAADEDYLNDPLTQESVIQDGSILSQAASSFSQLPSVASTVLSTFSKVIKEYTPTSSLEKKLDHSENAEEETPCISKFTFPSDSNSNYQVHSKPPKFYSPSDISVPTPIINDPPLSGNINSYRLCAKKKTYAQIPGLSQTSDKHQFLNPLDFNKNVKTPKVQNTPGDIVNVDFPSVRTEQTDNKSQYKTEEEKDGLFACSNLSTSNISSLIKENVPKYSTNNLLPAPPVIASSSNVISESTNNNNIEFNPVNKIEDTNITNIFKPSLSTGANYTVENTDFPKQLDALISQNTSNFQRPPSKNLIGSVSSNTFRLQKGTRHYKSALGSQLYGRSASAFIPQFPSISDEQNKLCSTSTLDSFNSKTTSEPNQKGQTTVEGISIYNPLNLAEILPTFSQQEHLYEQTELSSKEPIKVDNIFDNSSNSQINEIKSVTVDAGYGKDLLKGECELENLTIPEINSVKPEASELLTPEKSTLVEETIVISSDQHIIQKPSTNILKDFPKACSTEQLSEFSRKELEVQTIRTGVPAFIKQSGNFQPVDEALKSLNQQPSQQSLNLANYFNSFNLASQQQNPVTTESNCKLNQPLSEAVEVTLTNKANLLNSPNSLKTEEKASSSSSTNALPLDSDPLTFFDSFQNQTINQPQHRANNCSSLRIQDFFNNPLQNTDYAGNDLNCNSVSSGIVDKQSENLLASTTDRRGLSPTSNIVEPPSSPCFVFSSKLTSEASFLLKDEVSKEILDKTEMAGLLDSSSSEPYAPVSHHWFYKKIIDTKHVWAPFSYIDSKALEANYLSEENGKSIVAVEGGRYDVKIVDRTRVPVYWTGEPTDVRRCSWFYKAVDSKYIPYEEAVADLLEEEYKKAMESVEWHRKIALPTGETVVFHGPAVMVHFLQSQVATDTWANTSQTTARPRIVKRGIEDFDIEAGESATVDHLLFMVHGVGSACDLRFRPLEEVVDEFRSIALQLVQAHYKNSCDNGMVNRIEVLPVSWHSQLHSQESGIDEKLKAITLESIPKLRNFTNDTLLDILFYTSPVFCQNIMNTVCEALNNIFLKYCQRNPDFKGGVSLAGHSLGSLILFDLLCHQRCTEEMETPITESSNQKIQPFKCSSQFSADQCEPLSTQVSYTVGNAGTGQPYINYPQLIFYPKKFFALGSPIGMFVTIRGIETLGLDFKFPTCPNFFHIFHPYDPVAYRIEPLINPDLSMARPVLIPHHKGRKRMHLELKETMARVGADLKQKIVDAFKNTFDSVNFLSAKNKVDSTEEITKEVDKVLEMQLQLDKESSRSRTNSASTQSDIDTGEVDLPLGILNNNRRIDYVLQEAPLEFFNEYLFAFASHVCYWESEDTILFIMKEIYSSLGFRTDSQIPQQSMTIERPNSRISDSSVPPNI